MYLRILLLIFLFTPSLVNSELVISDVGYRDLKIGGSSELINKYCKETSHYDELLDKNVPSYSCYEKLDLSFMFETTQSNDPTKSVIKEIQVIFDGTSPNFELNHNSTQSFVDLLMRSLKDRYGLLEKCSSQDRMVELFKYGLEDSVYFSYGSYGEVELQILNSKNIRNDIIPPKIIMELYYQEPRKDLSYCYEKYSNPNDF